MSTNSNWHYFDFSCGTSSIYNASSPPIVYSSALMDYRAKAALGKGLISKLAMRAEELGFMPKCYSKGEVAYLQIQTYYRSEIDELRKYADELGFTEGEVTIQGESCHCKL